MVGLTNGNGASEKELMHIFFCPTLGIPITVLNSAAGVAARGSTFPSASFIGFPGQTIKFDYTSSGTTPPSGGNLITFNNLCGFNKWRIVSQGLRMELANSDEENDGWFEAVRFNWRNEPMDICFTPLDDSLGGSKTTDFGVAANPGNIQELTSMSMVEQPGYTTGLLKDLKNHEFMLHPQSTTHDPVVLEDTYSGTYGTGAGDDMYYESGNSQVIRLSGTVRGNTMKNSLVDNNMDWIYIRLHCRTNNGTTSNGSKLIVNAIQNLEVAFNPSSDFAAFQTINKMHPQQKKVDDQINNSTDASNKRQRTGGG